LAQRQIDEQVSKKRPDLPRGYRAADVVFVANADVILIGPWRKSPEVTAWIRLSRESASRRSVDLAMTPNSAPTFISSLLLPARARIR
jgi:hypothetical protein